MEITCFPENEEERRVLINSLLERWQLGDQQAFDEVFGLMFDDLVEMAHWQMNRERSGHTLQTGDLVSRLYLKLVDCKDKPWKERTHFKRSSARMMKQILIDHARSWLRRADGVMKIPMEAAGDIGDFKGSDQDLIRLLSLKQSIDKLETLDPRMAKIAYLHVVHGYTLDQVAEHLETALSNVKREWGLIKKIMSTSVAH